MFKLRLAELRQRFFPKRSITLSLQALEWCDDYFGSELMWPDVRGRLWGGIMLSDTAKREKFITDELKASRFLLDLSYHSAFNHIRFGERHVYRGILGFDGQSFRNIAEMALSQLYENDWLDYEEYKGRLDEIDAAVKAVG